VLGGAPQRPGQSGDTRHGRPRGEAVQGLAARDAERRLRSGSRELLRQEARVAPADLGQRAARRQPARTATRSSSATSGSSRSSVAGPVAGAARQREVGREEARRPGAVARTTTPRRPGAIDASGHPASAPASAAPALIANEVGHGQSQSGCPPLEAGGRVPRGGAARPGAAPACSAAQPCLPRRLLVRRAAVSRREVRRSREAAGDPGKRGEEHLDGLRRSAARRDEAHSCSTTEATASAAVSGRLARPTTKPGEASSASTPAPTAARPRARR
jgi:hypothetical protein